MLASEKDHKEVVTCLVEAKANLDLQNKVPSFPRDDEYSAMIMVVMITRMRGITMTVCVCVRACVWFVCVIWWLW